MYLNNVRRFANVLSSPNNILGIEYLKALMRLDSKISPKTVKRIVSNTDTTICNVKQFPIVSSALSQSPSPIKMDDLGAPLEQINAAKADTNNMIGVQTPTPVNASEPSAGICPK